MNNILPNPIWKVKLKRCWLRETRRGICRPPFQTIEPAKHAFGKKRETIVSIKTAFITLSGVVIFLLLCFCISAPTRFTPLSGNCSVIYQESGSSTKMRAAHFNKIRSVSRARRDNHGETRHPDLAGYTHRI
jgi:hypothetical protein